MNIKQSFLNSLKGLFKDQAEALVESEGLAVMSMEPGEVVALVVMPDTVYLWLTESNTVDLATAGDTSQVVDDT